MICHRKQRINTQPSNHESLLLRRHVIHTVGPVYSASMKEDCGDLLSSCYRSSLRLASEYELRHIVGIASVEPFPQLMEIFQAFPAISTGVYGYPLEDATHIVLKEVREYCESNLGAQVIYPLVPSKDNANILVSSSKESFLWFLLIMTMQYTSELFDII